MFCGDLQSSREPKGLRPNIHSRRERRSTSYTDSKSVVLPVLTLSRWRSYTRFPLPSTRKNGKEVGDRLFHPTWDTFSLCVRSSGSSVNLPQGPLASGVCLGPRRMQNWKYIPSMLQDRSIRWRNPRDNVRRFWCRWRISTVSNPRTRPWFWVWMIMVL